MARVNPGVRWLSFGRIRKNHSFGAVIIRGTTSSAADSSKRPSRSSDATPHSVCTTGLAATPPATVVLRTAIRTTRAAGATRLSLCDVERAQPLSTLGTSIFRVSILSHQLSRYLGLSVWSSLIRFETRISHLAIHNLDSQIRLISENSEPVELARFVSKSPRRPNADDFTRRATLRLALSVRGRRWRGCSPGLRRGTP